MLNLITLYLSQQLRKGWQKKKRWTVSFNTIVGHAENCQWGHCLPNYQSKGPEDFLLLHSNNI